MFMCAAISWAGAKDLDKFVAFIGSFAWWVFMTPILSHVGMSDVMLSLTASRCVISTLL